MSVPTHDFQWQQGEDGIISIVYKDSNNNPVDLTGASLRMDVAAQGSNTPLYTFNSSEVDDVLDPDSDEATLGGAAGTINIVVPRSVTLGTGALSSSIGSALVYDIFLRQGNTQKKLLSGTITIAPSVTKWV